MARPIGAFDVVARNMGVDLSGRDALMTEELLDATEIGASLHEVRRERMAQEVRVEVPPDASTDRVATEELPEGLASHRSPTWSGEEYRRSGLARVLLSALEVVSKVLERELTHRHDASLVSFSERNDRSASEVDVSDLERHHLARPKPSRVGEAEEGSVAQASECAGVGGAQEVEEFAFVRCSGKPAPDARRDETFQHFRLGVALLVEIAKKRPDRRDSAPEGAGPEAIFAFILHKLAQELARYGGCIADGARLAKADQSPEVSSVGELSVLRQAPPQAQMREKSLYVTFESLGHLALL